MGFLDVVLDVRPQCNIEPDDGTHDAELLRYTDATETIVESIVGPVAARTVTEWCSGGGGTLILKQAPVISVTSVTEWSGTSSTVTVEAADPAEAADAAGSWWLDAEAGILARWSGMFPCGRTIQVVYTAGRDPVPENIKTGALMIVEHLYNTSQQGGAPSPFAPGDVVVGGWSIPPLALELLQRDQRAPRVA